jgi:uncharacterized damage-inducible protein DinB
VTSPPDLRATIVAAWATTNRVTAFLIENLPSELWGATVPGAPRRTIRMIAAHLHNSRCSWTRTLGKEQGVAAPESVDRRTVTRRQLVAALGRSSLGIAGLLEAGFAHGGTLPAPATYAWRNLPLDVGHLLTYFVAHEGHHRGQIVMLARQLGHRLPVSVTGGVWDWTKRSREVRGSRR